MKTTMTKVAATDAQISLTDRIMVGIILEKRESRHVWQDHTWRAVSILPGGGPMAGGDAAADDGWRQLRAGPGWAHFYAGSLELCLFPKETDGYRQNLSTGQPKVYVVLRPSDNQTGEEEQRMEPFLATVCPHEAQDYLDSGEESVDGVPMPPETLQWVTQFIERHHIDEPFVKRKRNPKQSSDVADPFWRKPPVSDRD